MSTRVINVKLGEPFDVYIGRTMKQGYYGKHPVYVNQGWGNPFRAGSNAGSGGDALSLYRRWLLQAEQEQLLTRLGELRGKTLGCWCAPAGGLFGDIEGRVCHGEILAALADDPEPMIARMRQIVVRQDNLARRELAGLYAQAEGGSTREHEVGECLTKVRAASKRTREAIGKLAQIELPLE